MRRHPFPPQDARRAFGPWGRGGFGDFGQGWGPGPGRARGHRHGRGRRGDVRAAILALLAEKPRHGYEIIREIGERSGGFWRPSPGSVYPTLQLMADEGLVTSTEDGGKRLFELTEDGRAAAGQQDGAPPWEQITDEADPNEVSLRHAGTTLAAAAIQVSRAGTTGQKARAVDILNDARRALYGILGEVEEPEAEA